MTCMIHDTKFIKPSHEMTVKSSRPDSHSEDQPGQSGKTSKQSDKHGL